jgi:hypothetical protein
VGHLVSKKVLAEIVGVSERTLSDWQEKGMPIKVHTSRGLANEYDTANVFRWREEFVANGEKTETARERKDRLDGDLKELQLAKESAEILLREDVEFAWEGAIESAKSEFMASARKLKTKIDDEYGIDSELEIYTEHVRATLARLAEHAPEFDDDVEEGMEMLDAAAES